MARVAGKKEDNNNTNNEVGNVDQCAEKHDGIVY